MCCWHCLISFPLSNAANKHQSDKQKNADKHSQIKNSIVKPISVTKLSSKLMLVSLLLLLFSISISSSKQPHKRQQQRKAAAFNHWRIILRDGRLRRRNPPISRRVGKRAGIGGDAGDEHGAPRPSRNAQETKWNKLISKCLSSKRRHLWGYLRFCCVAN